MPRPVDSYTTYQPGLDGVRALAVALVIAFHLGLAHFQGGLLGVGIFFTLSGYLITGVLVGGWRRAGSWRLRTFWIRRARRLLPAVVMLLAVCLLVVVITDRTDLGRRAVEALAALFYVANWHTIYAGDSYFTQVHGSGPFDHLWSLSVEEQYYLVWPLLLAVLVAGFRARMEAVAAATALLAVGSFVVLALLAHPSMDNTRAYEGTDARAGGLLVGACLALLWRPPDPDVERRPRWRRDGVLLDALGVAGLAGIGWLVANTDESTFSLYRWGLLLLSVCTVALLAAVSHPATLLSRIFRIPPLRWLGERSYGLYLWHLPVIVFTPAAVLATHRPLRDVLQVALTVALAALSWTFVEDPIRTHGLVGAFRGTLATAPPGTSGAGRRSPGWAVGASAFLPVALLALLLTHALPRTGRAQLAAPPPAPLTIPTATPTTDAGRPTSSAPPVPHSSSTSTSPPPAPPHRTSCKSVILVGDSTSEGLYGPESALSPKQNLAGRLKHVGVRTFVASISGARSIIETYEDQASGEQVVEQHVRAGYRGCWIIALGNIDAATVAKYAPNTTSIADRISTVMRTIPKHSPVMWMTTRTILTDGDFRESVYPAWSRGLAQACGKYPNMRVYDWASAYKTSWIGPDGIHATTTGYRHKAALMARAMVEGFPATGPQPASCVIAAR